MCTVTFVPASDTVFLVHNRDEKRLRPRALPPAVYRLHGHTLLFPRDAQAGGTWVAINANGAAAVLLNGAFEKHVPLPPYRRSRGLALLDIVASAAVEQGWRQTALEGIEPFTVIAWSRGCLYELRWDGKHKHTRKPNAAAAHTWCSVTLYDEETAARRQQWFLDWRRQCPQPALDDVVRYHRHGGDGNLFDGLCMNRQNELLTVSITAMALTAGHGRMRYQDLCNADIHDLLIPFHPSLHTV